MYSNIYDIAVRSESVRVEFTGQWSEVRIGTAQFLIIHDDQAWGTLETLLLTLLNFARTVADDRNEKLEQYDSRSDESKIWLGSDVRDRIDLMHNPKPR